MKHGSSANRRHMGPHYGNDAILAGAGTYELSLLISPPALGAPRRIPERLVQKPHRVTFTFPWKPIS